MTQQSNNSDEIDLRDLFKYTAQGISNFFNSIINGIARVRRTTIRYKNMMLVTVIIFIGLAIAYSFGISKEVFGSSMLIKSQYFNSQLIENTISKLDALSKEENKTTLAKTLDIDMDVAGFIRGFEYEAFVTEDEKLEVEILKEKLLNLNLEEDIINSIASKIEIRNPNTFKITVLTEENAVMSTLDSAIFNYFTTNPYIKKRVDINRETLRRKKAKLQKEQLKIDSLKTTIFGVYSSMSRNQSSQGSDNVILAGQDITDPLLVFEQDIDFDNQILSIDQALFLQNEVEIIEGFTPFSKPVSIGSIWVIAYSALAGVGLAYLLIIIIELNRFLAAREKELNLS